MNLMNVLGLVKTLAGKHPGTIAWAMELYSKYQAAPPLVQEELRRCVREARRTGCIPLGYRKDEGEKMTAWWLVFDETKHASETVRLDALRAMTPPGVALKIVRL
jgi:hypothetical protein